MTKGIANRTITLPVRSDETPASLRHARRDRRRVARVGATLFLGFVVANLPATTLAATPAASTGPGEGHVTSLQGEGGCGDILLNSDGTYENGYAWQYGGTQSPTFGSFAECYNPAGPVCGATFDLTQIGNDTGQLMDVFVWGDNAGTPGAVLCAVSGVDPGPIAFWPSLSRHAVEIPQCSSGGQVWVGYWGAWPGNFSGWYIGADLDGFGGCPYTNIAPGIGYPTGWNNVSIVWGPTQAIGIGALFNGASVVGACCYPDGSCVVGSYGDCSGRFQGPDSTCDPNPCPQPGACCFPDGTCSFLLEFDCGLAGGDSQGPGTSCDPNPCPQPGACCFPTGDCTVLQSTACAEQQGSFFPDETTCDPNPCPQPSPGACCYPGGHCTVATIFDCQGGTFLGENTSCDPNPCEVPEFGACCYADGGCLFRLASSCDGDFQGAGTSCDPNPCPPPIVGACCDDAGGCTVLTQFDCLEGNGTFFGGVSCTPNPCSQLGSGACCLENGDCLSVDSRSCLAVSGEYQGDDTGCDPNPCPIPIPGACCLTLGLCEASDDVACAAAGGAFQGADSSCDPNPCPQPCEPFTLAGRESATRPAPARNPFQPGASGSDSAHRAGATGPNRGGVLVLHTDPSLAMTEASLGANCDIGAPVSGCESIVSRSDTELPTIVHAIALFPGASAPRLMGLTFGIDYPDCVQMLDWETCGDFEISDGSWPGPGSGTATTWAGPQTDLALPIYRFLLQGIAAEPGEFALAVHPTQGALFADDSVPSILDPIAGLGSFGFFRDGVTPCPGAQAPLGACCFDDSSCSVETFSSCEAAGGTYEGIDVPCEPNPCVAGVTGACCFPSDASCLEVNEAACVAGDGTYQGDHTLCDPNPCGPLVSGACCFGNGTCQVTQQSDCLMTDGVYAGNGSVCQPDPCPPTGACCFESGVCTLVFASYCNQIGGEFLGEDSECNAGTCPLPGACCFPWGACTVVHAVPCADGDGVFQGDGTSCDPNPCPQPPDGACCFPDGTCIIADVFDCENAGGDYFGEDTVCEPNPCPQPPDGACCLIDGSCLFIDSFECDDAGGEYQGAGTSCDPNPCPMPEIGACCLDDGSCLVLADYQCSDQNGRFLGDASVCEEVTCGIPCVPPTVSYSPGEPTRGPNANGALILHGNPSLEYSADEEYCGAAGLFDCADAVAETDREFETVVVHVLAAFEPTATPRVAGVVFGVSYADCLTLTDWSACGDFELPTAAWPQSGEGTAVTWGPVQTTNLTEVYWFAAYRYSVDPTALSLVPHPTQGAFFADDSVPSFLDPVAGLGSFGFGMAGSVPCPVAAVPGACCFADGSCGVTTEEDCSSSGGSFQGDGTVCDPTPCSTPAAGACCVGDTCMILSEQECAGDGGDYYGNDVPCDPDPCGAVPTIESSWGAIKERFRR